MKDSTTQGPRLDVLAVFCAAAAYLYLFVRVLWRVGDEGIILYGAARVNDGAVPFRDFFEVIGPLAFYWLASWFRLLGTNWVVSRALLLVTGACMACLVYTLTAKVHGRYPALVAALLCTVLGIPFWPAANCHWDSNLFFLTALSASAMWQSTRRAHGLVVAGVAAAATSGVMLHKGVLALLAVLAIVAWQDPSDRRSCRESLVPLGFVTVGFAGVAIAVVLWSLASGAARDLYYANVAWPWTRYTSVNHVPYGYYLRELLWPGWVAALGRLLPPSAALLVGSLFAVPLLALMTLPLLAATVIVRNLLRRGTPFDPAAAPLWLGGVALWLGEAHRWDIIHLMYGSPMLLAAVVGEVLPGVKHTRTTWPRHLVSLVLFCSIGLGAWNGLIASGARATQATRRGQIRTLAVDEALQFLNEETQPGEWLFVYPYYPTYYFLADVQNPTKYSILMYGINTDDQFRDAVRALELRRPRYVLWDTAVAGDNLKRWFPAYVRPPERDLIMENYLAEHYESIGIKSGFRVLQRRTEDGRRGEPPPQGQIRSPGG